MNAVGLLEHFERISEAPDAVARLRRFVLDLAVRGKLVESAGVWSLHSSVADFVDFQNGYAFKSEWFSKNGIRLCRNTNVGHGTLDWGKEARVPARVASEFERFYLAEGDLVLSLDRPIISTGLKVARVQRPDLPCLLLQRVARALPDSELISLDYLFLWLQSSAFIGEIDPGRSNGVPHISTKQVKSLAMDVPPLPEQHRIVAKVDELMALCDELEAAQTTRENRRDRLVAATHHHLNNGDTDPETEATFKQTANFYFNHLPRLTTKPEHVQQLRQTILNLAVRGKLVEQDPEDEPAAELLKRIEEEKTRLSRIGKGKLDQPPGLFAEMDAPFPLPETWRWVRVSDVANSRLGKMLDKAKNKGTYRRYLRNVNVRWFDFDLSDLLEMRFEEDELEKFALKSGDVLVCEGGEPGRAAVWDSRATDVYFQKAIHRVRLLGGIVPIYFARALYQDAASSRLKQYFTGVTIKHLTGKGLAGYSFPLPPVAEQHRIVAKVDELMAFCDELDSQLANSTNTHHQFLDATLNALAGARDIEEGANA